jgi:hypothetical protein
VTDCNTTTHTPTDPALRLIHLVPHFVAQSLDRGSEPQVGQVYHWLSTVVLDVLAMAMTGAPDDEEQVYATIEAGELLLADLLGFEVRA